MGSTSCYFPDYAILTNAQKGNETAKAILEAKYHILNSKQLENAFYQAKSYATRLGAKVIIIAASEGIWIFAADKKQRFKLDDYTNYSFSEISNSDNFHEVSKLIGYSKIKKYKS